MLRKLYTLAIVTLAADAVKVNAHDDHIDDDMPEWLNEFHNLIDQAEELGIDIDAIE